MLMSNGLICTDDGRTKPKPREGRPQLAEPAEYKCLVRAGLGGKKISTVVFIYFKDSC